MRAWRAHRAGRHATQDRPREERIVAAHGRDAADVAFISNDAALKTASLDTWVRIDEARPLP